MFISAPAALLSTMSMLGIVLTAGSLFCASRPPASQQTDCIVRRVVDGDTFHCRNGPKVRLIGIDSPERQQGPYGVRSRQALLRMAPPGTEVRLEHDVALTDRYGRLLAYAWIGNTFVNEALVGEGWAVLFTVPPNVKYAKRLGEAQNKARARGAGLWSERGFDCLPVDFRRGMCLSRP